LQPHDIPGRAPPKSAVNSVICALAAPARRRTGK
jgi:hypothetical protein